MALHTDTEIYKATYALAQLVTQLVANMPRNFKADFGAGMRRQCMALVMRTYQANTSQEKAPILGLMREEVEVINLSLRLAVDLRLISHKQFARAIALTTSISKQATGWQKHSERAPRRRSCPRHLVGRTEAHPLLRLRRRAARRPSPRRCPALRPLIPHPRKEIPMSEYQNLLARKAELDAQIAQAQAERKAEGIAAARALIQEHGLTAADVFPPAKSKGSVGAPKFRDPATGATWTGRGKPPNWILGKDRTPFQITPA